MLRSRAPVSTPSKANRTHQLLDFLSKYLHDHALLSGGFYIRVSIIAVLVLGVLFVYGYIRRLDEGSLSISPPVAANILLGCALLPFAVLSALRVTRHIVLEYAFFVLVAWIAYSVLIQEDCLCCSGSSMHLTHTLTNAPSTLDLVNHWIGRTEGLCTNIMLLQIWRDVLVVVLVFILYAVIIYDHDYFALAEAATARITARYIAKYSRDSGEMNPSGSDLAMLDDEENHFVGQFAWSRWARIAVMILAIGIMAVPLSCNNAVLMRWDYYLIRVVLFTLVFLLRLVNSYSARYNISKIAVTYQDLVKDKTIAKQLDARFEGVLEQIAINVHLPSNENMEDIPQVLREQLLQNDKHKDLIRTIHIRHSDQLHEVRVLMSQMWLMQRLMDIIVACYVLAVCEWFLVLVGAQVVIEFILFFVHFKRYRLHLAVVTSLVRQHQPKSTYVQ